MNAQARNQYGYLGLFQMGEAALIDAGFYVADGSGTNDWRGQWTGRQGVSSVQDFLNNPAAQAEAVAAYHQRLWTYIQGAGLDRYVGQEINGVQITRSGLIAAAHLVGAGSLAQYLRSNGAVIPIDGNRTPVTEYLQRFGGYELTGAGNNCAQFATGVPTGGVGRSTPGGTTPTAPQVGPVGVGQNEAFLQGSGVPIAVVLQTLQLVLAAIVIVTASILVRGSWECFAHGKRGERGDLVGDVARVSVIAILFLMLL